MFKLSHTYRSLVSLFIYGPCFGVGNWFDYASSRKNQLMMIGLIPGKLISQFVDRQHTQIIILALSVTVKELGWSNVASWLMFTPTAVIITFKSVTKHPCINHTWNVYKKPVTQETARQLTNSSALMSRWSKEKLAGCLQMFTQRQMSYLADISVLQQMS